MTARSDDGRRPAVTAAGQQTTACGYEIETV